MMDKHPRISKFLPHNAEYRNNGDALLKELREQCPVAHDEKARIVMLTRYKDIREILNDRSLWRGPEKGEPSRGRDRLLNDTFEVDPETGVLRTLSMMQMDDPDHSRVRTPIAKALYARASRSRPHIEQIVEGILDSLDGRSGFDILQDYAIPIPIDVIGSFLGVDRSRRDEFRDWSEGAVQSLNPARTPEQDAHRERSMVALEGYFRDLMRARSASPQDDLVTDMVKLKAEGADLSDAEICRNLFGLLVAGNLTTSDLIGNGVYLLLTHPDELAKLTADSGLISPAVEEILRYAPPNDVAGRIASRDMVIGGCPVAHAKSMIAFVRAANRDPDQFDDPDRFDISRQRKPHLSFGGGSHLCIGASLARIEAQVALCRLFARFPYLRLASPGEAPPKRTLPFLNGFERLDILN
jgi:cytochrome P450